MKTTIMISAFALLTPVLPAHAIGVCPENVVYVGPYNETVAVYITMEAPTEVNIDALGFDLVVDSNVLGFDSIEPGVDFLDWIEFDSAVVSPGQLRIGAFNNDPITSDSSTIVTIIFHLLFTEDGVGNLHTTNFTDDFAGAEDCDAFVHFTDVLQLDWSTIKTVY